MGMPEQGQKQIATPYYAYGILYLSPNFHRWEASQGARYRDYRMGWAWRAANHDHGAFPLNLNMEVTTRCNLACTFCTQPSLTKAQLGDMPWELYTRVMDEAEHYHVAAANLNGLGEPLLIRRLPDMLAYAKRRGILDLMFHSNGTVMTEPLARALMDSGLDRIIFSVDSPDRATYESMRIRSNWNKVIGNVRLFADVRARMGRTIPLIRTTMVVTDRTVHQIPDFVNLWKPIADQITLQDLTWRTKQLENGQWENREQSAIPVDMDQVREEAIRRKLSFVCPYLYQSSYVFWNGDVIPCSNPNARTAMVMGSMKTQTLHEIWHGQSYQRLRTLHATGRWYEHPVCRHCEVPAVELYKALEKDGVQWTQGKQPDAACESPAGVVASSLPVASEIAAGTPGAIDLVAKFQQQSGRQPADETST